CWLNRMMENGCLLFSEETELYPSTISVAWSLHHFFLFEWSFSSFKRTTRLADRMTKSLLSQNPFSQQLRNRLCAVADAQLFQGRLNVVLDGEFTEVDFPRDRLGAFTERQQIHDF